MACSVYPVYPVFFFPKDISSWVFMILYCVYVKPVVFSDAVAAWPNVQHAECGAGWAVCGGIGLSFFFPKRYLFLGIHESLLCV